MLNINKQFVQFRPTISIRKGTTRAWWKYAYVSTCETIFPYKFERKVRAFKHLYA